MNQRFTRRGLLKASLGAAVGAAGAKLFIDSRAGSFTLTAEAASPPPSPRYFLAGTDGWISLPGKPVAPLAGQTQYYPDTYAPQGRTTYVFGFANVTSMIGQSVANVTAAYKNKAQICAPLMYFDEDTEYVVRLTNLGLQQRPDLVDSHTIHWHGFRNVIPMFDGEPSSSIAVPIGRVFDYDYRPHNPGTYMYHCHFEDTEHVHMGMTGPLFVRPKQNTGNFGQPAGKYVYNDGDGSTAYDREYVIFLSEVWNQSHWVDAHIQLPDWTDYKADFFLMNGRVYPDTLLPNATVAANGLISNSPAGADVTDVTTLTAGHSATPDSPTIAGDLSTQPYSSLIKCNSGEKVLLRFINLGFTKASMTLDGIHMKVVGQDAVLLRGRNGADGSYETNTVSFGPGESVDAIFTAPAVTSESTYLLYNRNLTGLSNNGDAGLGGQMTEVHVRPTGTGAYPAQTNPNDL